MQTEFTPFLSLIGGAMIGLSAVIFMATLGRIAGISGIVSRVLPPDTLSPGNRTSLAFIAGLLLAAPVYFLATGAMPLQAISGNLALLIIAGLLVGFGSVTGGGCTSGHGVCGVSRLSTRSIVATVSFMATAFVTVLIARHVIGG
jgi:uncharacterized membrane protein YedE/YeeE